MYFYFSNRDFSMIPFLLIFSLSHFVLFVNFSVKIFPFSCRANCWMLYRFNEVYKINSCCPDGVINRDRFVFNLCFFFVPLAFFLYNSLFVVLTRSPSALFPRSLLFFLPRRFQTLPIQTTRWMRSRTSQVQYRRGKCAHALECISFTL